MPMLPRDLARRLLAENPTKPLIAWEHEGASGLADRATLEFCAADDAPTRAADIDEVFASATSLSLFGDFAARREGRVTARVVDAAEIDAFRRALAVDDNPAAGFHCMCMGDEQIDVCAGDVVVASIVVHHGGSLRWEERWRWDAPLKNGAAVTALLAKRGAAKSQQPDPMIAYEKKWRVAHLAAAPDAIKPIVAAVLDGTKAPRDAAHEIARIFAPDGDVVTLAKKAIEWKRVAPPHAQSDVRGELPKGVLGALSPKTLVDVLIAHPDLQREGIDHLVFRHMVRLDGFDSDETPPTAEKAAILAARVPQIFDGNPYYRQHRLTLLGTG